MTRDKKIRKLPVYAKIGKEAAMTMMDTAVKPIPAYAPPEDGKPRNAVDEKWMRLHRALMNRPARLAKKAQNIENSDRH